MELELRMREDLHPYFSFIFTAAASVAKFFSTIWTKFIKRFVLKFNTKKTLFYLRHFHLSFSLTFLTKEINLVL